MAFLLWCIGTILGKTWRITIVDPASQRPGLPAPQGRIYCFWHAHLLAISYIFRNTDVTALVSKSRDGRIAANVARRWNHSIVHGSSSKGASRALRECVRLLIEGKQLGITPDGPRGPRHKAKPGAAIMSMMAQVPIVALRVNADRFWQLASWDKFLIPKPFARVTVNIAPPLSSKDPGNSTTEHYCEKIEKELLDGCTMA